MGFIAAIIVAIVVGAAAQVWKGRTGAGWGVLTLALAGVVDFALFALVTGRGSVFRIAPVTWQVGDMVMSTGELTGKIGMAGAVAAGVVMLAVVATLPARTRQN